MEKHPLIECLLLCGSSGPVILTVQWVVLVAWETLLLGELDCRLAASVAYKIMKITESFRLIESLLILLQF